MTEQTAPSAVRLETGLEFERLLSELSSRFINLPPGEVDHEINDALRRVCELVDIDNAVLWQWAIAESGVLTPTHLYPAENSGQPPNPLVQEHYPWVVGQMVAGCLVAITSLEELPAEAVVDRENAILSGIKSNLSLPLSAGGGPPVGVLALNTLRTERDWPDELVQRLQLVAQVFTNALARRRSDLALQRSEARREAGADLAGTGFYEVDFLDRRAFLDDRILSIWGIPPEREDGLGPVEFWMEHLHPDDRVHVLEMREQLHNGEADPLAIEYRFLHPTTGERWIQHQACVAKRDAAGNAIQSYGAVCDITERHRAEGALRQSLVEIEQLKDRLQAETEYLRAEINVAQAHNEVTGQSKVIQMVLHQVEQVAPTDSTVLVHGETGTGKELVAQAIHRLSPRRQHVMVKINCAALPSGLIESELFGREKGAFTGALTRQIGRFEVADRSTLFLDEVGELPFEVQAKLLRVLETGEFERLGSPRTIKVNVRMIAATNRDLTDAVRQGVFREDLFYRLNVFPIRVPPLRERMEDIPLLVWTFLEEFSSRMGKKIIQVPRKTMDVLQRHPWPGNVRQLRNVIEHGAIITTGETLRIPAFDEATTQATVPTTLADAEREFIVRALERTDWRIKGPTGAATELGLNPGTLYGRMKKLGITRPRQSEDGS